eukprot:1441286-Pleurochrysis_carterae.AAC.1
MVLSTHFFIPATLLQLKRVCRGLSPILSSFSLYLDLVPSRPSPLASTPGASLSPPPALSHLVPAPPPSQTP